VRMGRFHASPGGTFGEQMGAFSLDGMSCFL